MLGYIYDRSISPKRLRAPRAELPDLSIYINIYKYNINRRRINRENNSKDYDAETYVIYIIYYSNYLFIYLRININLDAILTLLIELRSI